MRTSICRFSARSVISLVLSLAISMGEASSTLAQEPAPSHQQTQNLPSPQAKEVQVPSGAVGTMVSTNSLPDGPTPSNTQPQIQEAQSNTQSSGTGDQSGAQKPVGTAAAPYERTMGVAASRPAGAAIAPAKQRRVRTFLISAGLIAGAAIAVGSVAALSHASASRP